MSTTIKSKKSLLPLAIGACLFAVSIQAESLPELKIDIAKAELGKRLFFDPKLSGDALISCASCHQPKNGFSSKEKLSPGYPGSGHFRNVPTLINTAYKKVWMHDGRLGTNLNDVTREMITEDYIMNMDMRIMQERIKQDPVYVEMFKTAGYGEPSNGSVRKAIPEYLKTLTSKNTPADSGKLSPEAKEGKTLFEGKANCASCHSGVLYLDGLAHNTGVPENFDVFLDPNNHQAFLAFTSFMGVENYYNLKRDPGAHVQLHQADKRDMGKFMTPTLRELKYTAPYMHNGMMATLSDVIEFYNQGGGEDSNKSSLLKPLDLNDVEKNALEAYLLSLSGDDLNTEQNIWGQSIPMSYEAIKDWRNVKN